MIKVGYPYSYGDEDLNQDKDFMGFSLSPVSEDLKLNLVHASSIAIITQPSPLNFGDQFKYEFCDQISQVCGKFRYEPKADTYIIDYNGFCKVVSQSENILENISSELSIPNEVAKQYAIDFFNDNTIIVQAGGIQGTVYKVGSYLQSAGSAGLVTHTLGLARLAGVSGLQILKSQPALAIAIPTTGAMFFYGCGAIAGNTTLGKVFTTTGDVLALPMKGVEIMWNSYANPVVKRVFGIPVILNLTQTYKIGPGFTPAELQDYAKITKPSFIQYIKNKVIDWLS